MLEQIVRQNWAAFAENCAAVREQILTGPETSLPQMLLPSTDGGPLLQALRMALPGLAEEISQKRLRRSDFIAEGSDARASGNHASDFHIVHEQTDAQLLHRQRIGLQLVPQSAPVLLFQVASSRVEASPFYLKRLDPRGGARQVNLSSGTIIGGLEWETGDQDSDPAATSWHELWVPKPAVVAIGQGNAKAALWLDTLWLRADEEGLHKGRLSVELSTDHKRRNKRGTHSSSASGSRVLQSLSRWNRVRDLVREGVRAPPGTPSPSSPTRPSTLPLPPSLPPQLAPLPRCPPSRSQAFSVVLYLRPTVLVYAGFATGHRLIVKGVGCATVIEPLATCGQVLVHVDNSTDGEDPTLVDPRFERVDISGASRIYHAAGTLLLVVHGGRLVDAAVETFQGDGTRTTLHALRRLVLDGAMPVSDDDALLRIDLNEFNSCVRRLSSTALEAERQAFCTELTREYSHIEDGITGRMCATADNLVSISCLTGARATQTGVSGVVAHEDYNAVEKMADLVPLLLAPSVRRAHGWHQSVPVLIRAEAGSGKTWSLVQLTYLLAKALTDSRHPASSEPAPLVPLLIPIQQLVQYLRQRSHTQAAADATSGAPLDFVLLYLNMKYKGAGAASDDARSVTYNMLRTAYQLRTLVLIFDGLDEGASIRAPLERFFSEVLLRKKVRFVVSSRPEGVKLENYEQDYMIMNLAPLSEAQQSTIVQHQLGGDEFFDHFVKLSSIRKQHDQLYLRSVGAKERVRLEALEFPDHLLAQDGKHFDPAMRTHFYPPSSTATGGGGGEQEQKQGPRVVRALPPGVAPRSGFLTSPPYSRMSAELLASLHREVLALGAAPGAEVVQEMAEGLAHGACAEVAQLAARESAHEELTKLLTTLSLLLVKRREGDEPYETAGRLWSKIVMRTDELYQTYEAMLPTFEGACKALCQQFAVPADSLSMGGLKRPVRVHEKALDDYAGRFSDGALPEACVIDVVRARVEVGSGEALLGICAALLKGVLTLDLTLDLTLTLL